MAQLKFNNKFKFQTKKFWSLGIGLLAIVCNLVIGYWNLPLYAQDKIVAIVNKDIITQKDLNDFINFMRVQLSTQYQGAELENKIQSMKLDLLDKLIEDRLILQEAKKEDIVLNPDRLKAKINEIKDHYGSDSEFQNAIAKQGLVEGDIEAKITEQSLMFTVIEKEIKSKIIIKPVEVTDFYQENIKKFILPEQREFESVAFDSESLAYEVLNKLKSGQELKDIADRYSLAVNKFNTLKDGQLRKDIEDTLFKLEAGQISSIVKIENKYYIFKLGNIMPPHQQNLSQAQEDIHAMLYNKKMQEALTKWLEQLKAHSYIKILQN